MKGCLEPPHLRIGPETEKEHRHTTWLELFYDLVFVVAISQIAHYLHENVSWSGFFGFVFLFLSIWWAVLGEAIIAVVNGVSEKHWDVGNAISAVLGFILAFGLW